MNTPSHNPLTFFAQTNFRKQGRVFGIPKHDRRSHMHLIGKTGTGKSSLLEILMHHDITANEGFILMDPHGDLVERVLTLIPDERKADVVYFNVPDFDHVLGFNPLERVAPKLRALAASSLIHVFKKIWHDSYGPRLEHILRNAFLLLLEQPQDHTLADVLRLLSEKPFRLMAAANVYNPQVRNFWLREYESYTARFRMEAIAPIQNKVGAFLADPLLRTILMQPRSAFDIRQIMDDGKILLVNLSRGKIGEDVTVLLGALLLAKIEMAGFSRANMPEESRRDCYVYLDEFPLYTTLHVATMLSELRKYHIGIILAQQYFSQLELDVRDAVLGNAGTLISFRVGPVDAELLAKEFMPEIMPLDLMNLPNHHIYLKLMVHGMVTRPFSATILQPPVPDVP